MNVQASSFPREEYRRIRALWRGQPYDRRKRGRTASSTESLPFERGRDPRSLGNVLEGITRDFGWAGALSQVSLIEDWPTLVGESVAAHTEVIGVRGEVLVIQCDSTAWTTELRRLRADIVTKILSHYPDAGISDIKLLAPGAPSWRHGSLHVSGRGPRDTYS